MSDLSVNNLAWSTKWDMGLGENIEAMKVEVVQYSDR